jgi:hypothetical protein
MHVRELEERDRQTLEQSISNDSYHKDTTGASFFYDKRALCHVYENNKPVMFVKGSPILRLDIQFAHNDDKFNNVEALQKLSEILETAKSSGFLELVFCTSSDSLKNFCVKHFGFVTVEGELRRYL